MHQIHSVLNRFRPVAPLVLRVVIGGLFIWHGIDKFDTGISMGDSPTDTTSDNRRDDSGFTQPARGIPPNYITVVLTGRY